jgi:hypothetical protein
VALGHRRLAIVDLSERGAQPMRDQELGLTIVFNGCIYNHDELRARLGKAGYRFFSRSDTEVILKAFHAWGERCVEEFKGMFAFCIREHESGRLFLARDRLGIKPLYYTRDNGAVPLRLDAARADPRRARLECPGSRGPASLHELPLRGAGAPHAARGRPQAAARPLDAHRAGRARPGAALLVAALRRGWPIRDRRGAGRTPSWSPCAPRSAAGWWATCRSACCSRAASIPA